MKNLIITLLLIPLFITCKSDKIEQKVNSKIDICKEPDKPFLYLEAENFEIEVHKSSSGISPVILVANNLDALKNLKIYSSTGKFGSLCPCNLPEEFKAVGLKLRVSGKSITNGDRITNYIDSNGNDIAISGSECIRFEITKIEKL